MHFPLGADWMWMGIPWVLVLVVVVLILARTGSGRDSAEEILKRRYARGEITKDEYESMLQEIKK